MKFHSLRSYGSADRRRARARALGCGLALMLVVGTAAPVAAQEGPRNLIAFGAISVPEFEGSSDRVAAPLLIGRLDLGTYGSLRLAGPGLQYNLLGERSNWAVGPVLSFRAARDADVEDEAVRRLREVDGAVEFGAFVEYGFRDTLASGDRIALGVEGKGGDGRQLSLGASYQGAKQGDFQFGLEARALFANDEYMDRYFSVDADNSVRSGLPQYTATGGVKSMSLALSGSYDLTREWSVIGRLGFTRLLGDARDSPIVQLRGDENSASLGLAIGYRF